MDRKTRTKQLLTIAIPELDGILADMEKNGGWLNFNEQFITAINTSGIKWWEYYENEKLLRALNSLMFFDPEELKNIHEQGTIDKILDEFSDALKNWDEIEQFIEEEQTSFDEFWNKAKEETQLKYIKKLCTVFMGTITSLFNYLSLMVHGRTLCQLVSDAKNGDRDAFCLAVQIDRTVLYLPYFRERIIQSQFTSDQDFLSQLGARLQNPIIKSKIRYRTLWLTFAILEDEKLLELPHEEILDICEEVGVYGKKFGVEDVGHLSKRLNEYRKKQRTPKIF